MDKQELITLINNNDFDFVQIFDELKVYLNDDEASKRIDKELDKCINYRTVYNNLFCLFNAYDSIKTLIENEEV